MVVRSAQKQVVKSDRLIRIVGTIDEASFKEFSEQLYAYEQKDNRLAVTIELSSGGGVAYDALAFGARMRNSPCDIIVKAYGFVASAAVLILAYGDARYMAAESWVMVHEDSDKLKGSVVDLERESKHLRCMERQWAFLLAARTKTLASKWATLHKDTTYLTAQECMDLGLVDKII